MMKPCVNRATMRQPGLVVLTKLICAKPGPCAGLYFDTPAETNDIIMCVGREKQRNPGLMWNQ